MNKRPFNSAEIEYLKEHYPNMSSIVIARELKRNVRTVYSKAYSLGLKKTQEFLKSKESGRLQSGTKIGEKTYFQKGSIPPNKGEKMSPELYKKVSHTFFQKGHKPKNTKWDGYISIRTMKGIPYFYVRVAEGKHELLSRVLWEKAKGDIPKGYNIVFKDGNQANVKIDNLEIISDAELMKRNSFYKYPKDIQNLIHAKAALQREINKILNNE